MTDSKRAGSSRGGKRKPRAKAEKEQVAPPAEETESSEEARFTEGEPARETHASEGSPHASEERSAEHDRRDAYRDEDDYDDQRDYDRDTRESRDRDRDFDRDRDEDRARDRDRDEDRGADRDRDAYDAPRPARALPSDEYAFQIFYDKSAGTFTGTVLEVPEIRATGYDRNEVSAELENRLETHLQKLRGKAPEPFSTKVYPEKLDVRISQSLFRRLDMASRQEKVPLDQLVAELLTNALDKKEIASGHRHQHQHQQHHQQHHRHGGRDHQRHGGGHGGGHRDHGGRHGQSHGGRDHQGSRQSGGRRGYQDTLNNRENFMEYVRNLEKGGGTPPSGFKKPR